MAEGPKSPGSIAIRPNAPMAVYWCTSNFARSRALSCRKGSLARLHPNPQLKVQGLVKISSAMAAEMTPFPASSRIAPLLP